MKTSDSLLYRLGISSGSFLRSIAIVGTICLFHLQAQATLLVYDGFNYAAGQNLAGQTGGSGWSAPWEQSGTENPENYQIVDGLSFGSLSASGNAVRSAGNPDWFVVGRSMTNGIANGDTFWASYLFQGVNTGSGGADETSSGGVTIRTAPTEGDSTRFTTWAMKGSRTSLVSVTNSDSGTSATAALAFDTTYLLISKFDNIGQGANNPQTATLWALSLEDFGDFLIAGANEAALDAKHTAKATNTSINDTNFSAGLYLNLINNESEGVWDELRLGTTLESVTPVPEPTTYALIFGLSALGLLVRRYFKKVLR